MKYIIKEEVDTIEKMIEFINKHGDDRYGSKYICIYKKSIDIELYNYIYNEENEHVDENNFKYYFSTINNGEFFTEDLNIAERTNYNTFYFV